MAQESSVKRSASGIEYAPKRRSGYDAAQVDAFLEHAHHLYESDGNQLTQSDIQNASFDVKKGGYVIEQVDAALSRLERAVIDKQTQWEMNQLGLDAWRAQNEELYYAIARRAQREHGIRFADGKPRHPSYDRKQVDTFIDQVVRKCAVELGDDDSHLGGLGEFERDDLADVSASTVSNVIFTQRKGERGYDERQVDNFLNACVNLLSRLESYARLADYAPANNDEETTVQPTGHPQGITPLFGGAQDTPIATEQHSGVDLPQSFAPSVPADSAHRSNAAQPETFAVGQPVDAGNAADQESYNALQRAEQQVFGGVDANQTIVIPPSSLQQPPSFAASTSTSTASGSEDAPSFGGDSFNGVSQQNDSDAAVSSLAALAHSAEHPHPVKRTDAAPEPAAPEPAAPPSQVPTTVASEPADAPASFPPASPRSHHNAEASAASTEMNETKSSDSSPHLPSAFGDLTFALQHTETEQTFDDLPDLSFPVFKPKHQQGTAVESTDANADVNGDESEIEGDSEPNDHASSGGE